MIFGIIGKTLFAPRKLDYTDTLTEPLNCRFPLEVPVKNNVLNKICLYGDLVNQAFGKPLEYHGILFADKRNAVHDAHLMVDQVVSMGHTFISEASIGKTREKFADSKHRICGSFHRHPINSFSNTDHADLTKILNATYVKVGDMQYVYDMVLTPSGFLAQMAVRYPCGAIVAKARPIKVCRGGARFDEEEMRREVLENVQELVYTEPIPPVAKYVAELPGVSSLESAISQADIERWETEVSALLKKGTPLYDAVFQVGTPACIKVWHRK